MEIGDVVTYEGKKGVITRLFNAGPRGETPYITAWFGNSMLTAPANSVGLTEEKCPQIKCVLYSLGQLGDKE